MGRKKDPEKIPSPSPEATHLRSAQEWSPLTRIAFRFCVVYFGLYVLASQILGSLLLVPYFQFRGLGPLWPMREITRRVAASVFHITTPLTYTGDNIGE